jgi:DNA-binding MarR family transcriptional regulator
MFRSPDDLSYYTVLMDEKTGPSARRILRYLAERRAVTVLEIAPIVGIDPEWTSEILRELERERLVRRGSSSGIEVGGIVGSIYSPTPAGLDVARRIRA